MRMRGGRRVTKDLPTSSHPTVALTSRGLLDKYTEPTALLAAQVPGAAASVSNDAGELSALPFAEGLVHAVAGVFPERPSHLPNHCPLDCSPACPKAP